MKKTDWIWMPHPGHFICGYMCQFKLNTYVGKYIVSTVGEIRYPQRTVQEIHAKIYDAAWLETNKHLQGDYFDLAYMKKFGFQDIGVDRKYETMVFEARKSIRKCCPWEINVKKEKDMEGYNKPEDAVVGHMKLCNKWSK